VNFPAAQAQAQAQAAADFGCYMRWRQRDKRSHFSIHCITIVSAALLSNRIEFDHSDLSIKNQMKKGSLSTPVSSSHLLPAKPLSTLCQRIALSSPASAKAWVAAQKLQPTQKSKKTIISSKDTEPMTFATLVGRSNPASIPTPALALDHTHVGCVASESDCDVGHVAPETDCDLDIDDAIVSATASGSLAPFLL
jgi:hypothetical protein